MIEEFRVKLGEFIKNKRESLSLSREDLAKELEVSRVTVSNIEQGAHNIAFVDLMKLSAILHFGINEIVALYDQESIQKEIEDKPEKVKNALSKYL